jgi:serine phosphatase RsbU (regulator of sigma subunit)
MDMAIVKLGLKDTRTLIFAGAKRPLNYIEANNPTVMKNIMGSRKSIGGTQNEAKDFEETQLTLPANSMLYLSSDGLADQNDLNRKRLKEEPVWEALLANYAVSLEAQKQAVQILLDKHMIGTEQRDDVLLLGVKI